MSAAEEGEARLMTRKEERPSSTRRKCDVMSDHPARAAEMPLERTYQEFQRIMHETGMDARGLCGYRD